MKVLKLLNSFIQAFWQQDNQKLPLKDPAAITKYKCIFYLWSNISLIPHKKTKNSQQQCFQVIIFTYFHNEINREVVEVQGLGKEDHFIFT